MSNPMEYIPKHIKRIGSIVIAGRSFPKNEDGSCISCDPEISIDEQILWFNFFQRVKRVRLNNNSIKKNYIFLIGSASAFLQGNKK